MTLPLNGDALLAHLASNLKPSPANQLRAVLEGIEPPKLIEDDDDDTPDGTNGATKEEQPLTRAVDPTQGQGNARKSPRDPLLESLQRAVGAPRHHR